MLLQHCESISEVMHMRKQYLFLKVSTVTVLQFDDSPVNKEEQKLNADSDGN